MLVIARVKMIDLEINTSNTWLEGSICTGFATCEVDIVESHGWVTVNSILKPEKVRTSSSPSLEVLTCCPCFSGGGPCRARSCDPLIMSPPGRSVQVGAILRNVVQHSVLSIEFVHLGAKLCHF